MPTTQSTSHLCRSWDADMIGEHCLCLDLEDHRKVLLFASSSRKPGMGLLITHPDLEEHLRDWVWKKIPDRRAPSD